mgnify:CR=1 FL=1
MTKAQIEALRLREGIKQGEEWDRLSGLRIPVAQIEDSLARVPFRQKGRRRLQGARIPSNLSKARVEGAGRNANGVWPRARRDRQS